MQKRKNEVVTEFRDQMQHKPSNVHVSLHPERSLHLEVGHEHIQLPRAVSHQIAVSYHLVCGLESLKEKQFN